MADAALLSALCEETTCPICLEHFAEPVTLDCGHNFCRACISHYWEEFDLATTCPQCREVILHRDLRPNRQLANVIEIVKKLEERTRAGRGEKGRGLLCERHPREPLKLLCREDGEALICAVCDGAREHQDQDVVPLEEGAPKYKACLEAEKQKITFGFERMHTFLQEKQHLRLVNLRGLVKELKEREGEIVSMLSEEICHLSRLVRKTERKVQQVPTEFLQEAGSTMHRYEEGQERQVVEFSQGLEERQRISSQKHSKAIENCQELLNQALNKVNATLDPDTANPFLILSEDLKSVRRGSRCQNLPDTPQRFDIMMCVLGQERFTSGRHWWEVEVEENLGRWAMGVARESIRRKGLVPVSPDEGLWAMGQSFSYSSSPCQFLAFTSPQPTPLTLRHKLRKIRVSLDYRKGCVEFFDGDANNLIFAFLSASFSGERICPFFRVWKGAKLKCC
ncbi:PREDICTED: zinc finger protein RFP-like [Gekko japonicus]|uniref:Zinc finger protein RFP-like n=1 Tax=Gekko japonicus TaxID=146911 RepID=A0ABM1K9T7_GEKJA|nr:PREDICTED: zinc finger protein RFP-like [Gekko japonicus]